MDQSSGTSADGVVQDAADTEVLELLAKLSPRKRATVDALIVGLSVQGAADKAGVHRGTVSRWILKDEHFNAALNALQMEAIRVGHHRLISLIPIALMAVENAINKGDVRAALQILKHTLFVRQASAPISPELVAREMHVAELQQEVALLKQQTEMEELSEETINRSNDVAQSRRWRIQSEKEQKEAAEQRKAEAARKAAEAKARQEQKPQAAAAPKPGTSAQQPAQAQPTAQAQQSPAIQPTTSTQPGQTPHSAPQPKHPGQPAPQQRDARITAAAKAAAGALSNPSSNPGAQTKQ